MSRLKALLALFALACFGLAQQPPPQQSPPPTPDGKIDAKAKQDVLDGLQTIVTKRAFVPGVDFSKWPDFVAKRKDDIDKADTDVALTRVLNGILRDFGVSHIRFRTPQAARMRQTGQTSGLGMQVKKTDAGLEVTSVVPSSPAGQVGIEVGDVIKEVEHKPADDAAALRVEVGKSILVKVEKKGGDEKEITLENKTYSNRRPETLTWIADDAAVLRIWTFSTGYDRKNVESLIKEANAKAKYLIIDLRSNGGGAVSNLRHFLSLLMPDGTAVGTFVGRSVVDDYLKDHAGETPDTLKIAAWDTKKFTANHREGLDPFTGKIAVLINRGSASASEICSAALKDCRDAVLVGQKSAGAVLASVYGRLPGGFELQYPIQDYVTIKGERLEANPRVPDLDVPRVVSGPDDTPEKALDLLKKKASERTPVEAGEGHGQRRAA